MKHDRTVRLFTALQESASTARVLNLIRVHADFPDDPQVRTAPFFRNRLLDNSLIIKHRLRRNEGDLFKSPRTVATKIVFPIDRKDFRFGGRSFLVGESDFDAMVSESFGDDLKRGSHDRRTLELIDSLPTLDPFILKGYLGKHDIHPAPTYFAISEGDVQRMLDFVRLEITALVHLSTGSTTGASDHVTRMVEKLLSNDPNSGFEPLRDVLKLNDQEYSDGIFCWRGFLYYKWVLVDLMRLMVALLSEIETIRASGPVSADDALCISKSRHSIQNLIVTSMAQVQETINIYNHAYAQLTKQNSPKQFRDFLLSSPDLFFELGQRLGVLQHTFSFWRYRFPLGQKKSVSHQELMDIFIDFEEGLSLSQ